MFNIKLMRLILIFLILIVHCKNQNESDLDSLFIPLTDNVLDKDCLKDFKQTKFDSAIINCKNFNCIFFEAFEKVQVDSIWRLNMINVFKKNDLSTGNNSSKNLYVFVAAYYLWLNNEKVNLKLLKSRVYKLLDSTGNYY